MMRQSSVLKTARAAILWACVLWILGARTSATSARAQVLAQVLGDKTLRLDIGAPAVRDLWVDPRAGNDARSGATRALALRTLDAAWRRVPGNAALTIGFRINMVRGVYPERNLPVYMENRRGTAQCPIIIRAVDGRGSAVLGGDLSLFNCSYVYLLDLNIVPAPAGDTLHLEKCRSILMRGLLLDGGRFVEGGPDVAHDNLKVNQSQYVYLEDCEVRGAGDNAVDYVAVQFGHATRNRIHNANDWGFYAKGGSAYLTIEGNEIYDCGTGGFTAGQGTGFQFMVAPWIHYEAHSLKIINNVIHDCAGAGLGVNGGFNILMAHNTLVRVGRRSHAVEFVHGGRSCDGTTQDDRSACGENLNRGGWGTRAIDDGTNFVRVPNKNVFFFNNIIYNPPESAPVGQIFSVAAPFRGAQQNNSNAPAVARADENLQIKGNLIWLQTEAIGVGGESDGCAATNAACNEAQIRRDNTIDTLEPQFVAVARNDFHAANSNIARAHVCSSRVSHERPAHAPSRPDRQRLERTGPRSRRPAAPKYFRSRRLCCGRAPSTWSELFVSGKWRGDVLALGRWRSGTRRCKYFRCLHASRRTAVPTPCGQQVLERRCVDADFSAALDDP